MWQSLRLSKKIWLSVSILVLGYFGSMVFGFVLGQRTEARLHVVSESMFPAAMHSQRALSAFNEQIKLYTDAVMVGETDLLETAKSKSHEVIQALQAITSLMGLHLERRSEVRETLNQFETFSTSAQTVYAAMSDISDDQEKLAELGAQASQLAQHSE